VPDDSALADEKLISDLFIGKPVADELQYLFLPAGELDIFII
jgi:hypothetical protein